MDCDDLILQSAGLIGAVTQGAGINESEADDCFTKLNILVDSWNADPLKHYAILSERHTLTAHNGVYTLGPAGSFSTARPVLIESASIILSGLKHQVDLIPKDEYDAILEPTGEMTVPRKLYDDGGHPLRTIRLWPVPSGTPDLEVNSPFIIPQFAARNTAVDLPPAYLKALIYTLAVDVAPSFRLQLDESIPKIAAQAQADMKIANVLTARSFLRVEKAVPPRGAAALPEQQ